MRSTPRQSQFEQCSDAARPALPSSPPYAYDQRPSYEAKHATCSRQWFLRLRALDDHCVHSLSVTLSACPNASNREAELPAEKTNPSCLFDTMAANAP